MRWLVFTALVWVGLAQSRLTCFSDTKVSIRVPLLELFAGFKNWTVSYGKRCMDTSEFARLGLEGFGDGSQCFRIPANAPNLTEMQANFPRGLCLTEVTNTTVDFGSCFCLNPPTQISTQSPTLKPSRNPSVAPTFRPSLSPTMAPSPSPTKSPTQLRFDMIGVTDILISFRPETLFLNEMDRFPDINSANQRSLLEKLEPVRLAEDEVPFEIGIRCAWAQLLFAKLNSSEFSFDVPVKVLPEDRVVELIPDLAWNVTCVAESRSEVKVCHVSMKFDRGAAPPTMLPTVFPSSFPTLSPSESPTAKSNLTLDETNATMAPVPMLVTETPTLAPSFAPTNDTDNNNNTQVNSTQIPTLSPTLAPVKKSTDAPTRFPTRSPTVRQTPPPTKPIRYELTDVIRDAFLGVEGSNDGTEQDDDGKLYKFYFGPWEFSKDMKIGQGEENPFLPKINLVLGTRTFLVAYEGAQLAFLADFRVQNCPLYAPPVVLQPTPQPSSSLDESNVLPVVLPVLFGTAGILTALFVARRPIMKRLGLSKYQSPRSPFSSGVAGRGAFYDENGGFSDEVHSIYKDLEIDVSQLALGPVIGHGANGRIFRAQYCGSDVAVKELFPNLLVEREPKSAGSEIMLDPKDQIWREVRNLRLLRHPNIIQLYGCAQARSEDTGQLRFLVVMELATCSLREILQHHEYDSLHELPFAWNDFDFSRKILLCKEVSAGMAYIHDSNMIHFDLKPENILLNQSGQAKICDLGIAKLHAGPNQTMNMTLTSMGGTPPYMAPEMLRGVMEQIGMAVDVYAFGIVLWQTFHPTETPHPRQWTVAKLFHEVMVCDYRPAIHSSVNPLVAQLIRRCWDADHRLRPTFPEVLRELDVILDSTGNTKVKRQRFASEEDMDFLLRVGSKAFFWEHTQRRYVRCTVKKKRTDADAAWCTFNIELEKDDVLFRKTGRSLKVRFKNHRNISRQAGRGSVSESVVISPMSGLGQSLLTTTSTSFPSSDQQDGELPEARNSFASYDTPSYSRNLTLATNDSRSMSMLEDEKSDSYYGDRQQSESDSSSSDDESDEYDDEGDYIINHPSKDFDDDGFEGDAYNSALFGSDRSPMTRSTRTEDSINELLHDRTKLKLMLRRRNVPELFLKAASTSSGVNRECVFNSISQLAVSRFLRALLFNQSLFRTMQSTIARAEDKWLSSADLTMFFEVDLKNISLPPKGDHDRAVVEDVLSPYKSPSSFPSDAFSVSPGLKDARELNLWMAEKFTIFETDKMSLCKFANLVDYNAYSREPIACTAAIHLPTFAVVAVKQLRRSLGSLDDVQAMMDSIMSTWLGLLGEEEEDSAHSLLAAHHQRIAAKIFGPCRFLNRFYGCYFDQNEQALTFLNEFMDGGSLLDVLLSVECPDYSMSPPTGESSGAGDGGDMDEPPLPVLSLRVDSLEENEEAKAKEEEPISASTISCTDTTPFSTPNFSMGPRCISDESVLATIAHSILSALAFLHDKNLVHKGVKPSNILLSTKGEVKLGDFGMYEKWRDPLRNDLAFDVAYQSPEQLATIQDGESLSCASDVWSFMMCLVTAALGRHPFEHVLNSIDVDQQNQTCETLQTTYRTWCDPFEIPAEVPFPTPDSYNAPYETFYRFSSQFRDFVSQGLVFTANERASASDLLKHPWLLTHVDQTVPVRKGVSQEDEEKLVSDIANTVVQRVSGTLESRKYLCVHPMASSSTLVILTDSVDRLAEQFSLTRDLVIESFIYNAELAGFNVRPPDQSFTQSHFDVSSQEAEDSFGSLPPLPPKPKSFRLKTQSSSDPGESPVEPLQVEMVESDVKGMRSQRVSKAMGLALSTSKGLREIMETLEVSGLTKKRKSLSHVSALILRLESVLQSPNLSGFSEEFLELDTLLTETGNLISLCNGSPGELDTRSCWSESLHSEGDQQPGGSISSTSAEEVGSDWEHKLHAILMLRKQDLSVLELLNKIEVIVADFENRIGLPALPPRSAYIASHVEKEYAKLAQDVLRTKTEEREASATVGDLKDSLAQAEEQSKRNAEAVILGFALDGSQEGRNGGEGALLKRSDSIHVREAMDTLMISVLGSSSSRRNHSAFQATIPSSHLRFEDILGKGAFGTVVRGKWKQKPVAIKVISYRESSKSSFSMPAFLEVSAELHRWRSLVHENIVRLYGCSLDKDREQLYFVMELCDMSLERYLYVNRCTNLVDLDVIRRVGSGIAKGLAYLHQNLVVHRDIKPQNVLVRNGTEEVKLCDFGMSMAKLETVTTVLDDATGGTPAYMAPELASAPAKISYKSDVYSLGILLGEMVERRKPYPQEAAVAIMVATIKGARPPLTNPSHFPDWLITLIESCWDADRSLRPSASQVADVLLSTTRE